MNKRKFLVIGILASIFVTAMASTHPSERVNPYKNLKVLPKNISTKTLSRIMVDDFEDGLGVSCNFCHAEEKGSHRLDYASDAKPEKEIARMMMRMSVRLNRKYFRINHPLIGDSSLVITCNTCHHGQPHPDNTNEGQ
jgi:hypothetical protein